LYDREEPSKLNTDSLFKAAVTAAKNADVVYFIGGLNKNHFQDSEGGDRKSYLLPFEQDKLIEAILKVNKKVAVILISGNAVAMPWVKDVPAIVQSWYLGSEGGNAIANVLDRGRESFR
jgi:beta-glucosidase